MNLTSRTEENAPYWYCMSGCLDSDDLTVEGGGGGPGSDAAAEAHAHDYQHRTRVHNGSSTTYEPAGVARITSPAAVSHV